MRIRSGSLCLAGGAVALLALACSGATQVAAPAPPPAAAATPPILVPEPSPTPPPAPAPVSAPPPAVWVQLTAWHYGGLAVQVRSKALCTPTVTLPGGRQIPGLGGQRRVGPDGSLVWGFIGPTADLPGPVHYVVTCDRNGQTAIAEVWDDDLDS